MELSCVENALTEEEIIEHSNEVCWSAISEFQKLSPAFIHKHQDKLDWAFIVNYQILPCEFLIAHDHLITYSEVCPVKSAYYYIKYKAHIRPALVSWDAVEASMDQMKKELTVARFA